MADAIEDDYPNPDIRENGDLILYEIATDKLDPSERPIVTWSKFTPGVAHLTRDAKIAIRRFMLTEKYFRKGVGSVASRSRKEWSNLLADSGLDDPDVNQIARDAVKQAMEKEVISVSENWMKSGIWGLGELFTSKSSPQKHDRDGNPKLSKVTLNPVVQHLMNNAEEWKKWDGEFPVRYLTFLRSI